MSRTTRAVATVVATAAVGTALTATFATAASAHVTVKPESTVAESFTQLVFRVPNESDTASTVKLEVTLPEKAPLLYVSTLPIPGWSVKVTKSELDEPVESFGSTITEAPRSITWTATGDGVEPGEYQNFAISAGPLPASGDLVFPAVQTYSDGEVANWTEIQKTGAEEAEHPAPSFTVTKTTAEHAAAEAAEAASGSAVESDDSNTATALAVAGLVVALVALVLALVAVVRGRRSTEV